MASLSPVFFLTLLVLAIWMTLRARQGERTVLTLWLRNITIALIFVFPLLNFAAQTTYAQGCTGANCSTPTSTPVGSTDSGGGSDSDGGGDTDTDTDSNSGYVAPELEPTYQTPRPDPTENLTTTPDPCVVSDGTDDEPTSTNPDPCNEGRSVDVRPTVTPTVTASPSATPAGNESVAGTVWVDMDADGQISDADLAVAGVYVELHNAYQPAELPDDTLALTQNEYDVTSVAETPSAVRLSSSSLVNSARTDVDGAYNFEGLAAGDYWVQVTLDELPIEAAPGQTVEPQLVRTPGQVDVLLVANPFLPTTLVPGNGVISGLLFHDGNANATYEPKKLEGGINDVDIDLYLDGGDGKYGGDDIKAFTTTTANGMYAFEELGSGMYWVAVDETTLPEDYIDTGSMFGRPDQNPRQIVINELAAEQPVVVSEVDFAYAEDTDGDNVPNLWEGKDDRDGDGVVDWKDSYDPSGYVYVVRLNATTGEFETLPAEGMTVTLDQSPTCGANVDDIMAGSFTQELVDMTNSVVTGPDGSYRFEIAEDTGGQCGLTGVEQEYVIAVTGPFSNDPTAGTGGSLDPYGTPAGNNPIDPHTGETLNASGLTPIVGYTRIPTFADSPEFYSSFLLSLGDEITNNHIPVFGSTIGTASDASYEVTRTAAIPANSTVNAGGIAQFNYAIENTSPDTVPTDTYTVVLPTYGGGERAGFVRTLRRCTSAACTSFIGGSLSPGTPLGFTDVPRGESVWFAVFVDTPLGEGFDLEAPYASTVEVESTSNTDLDLQLVDTVFIRVGCVAGLVYLERDGVSGFDDNGPDRRLGNITVSISPAGSGIQGTEDSDPTNSGDPSAAADVAPAGLYVFENLATGITYNIAIDTGDLNVLNDANLLLSDPDNGFVAQAIPSASAAVPTNASSGISNCQIVNIEVTESEDVTQPPSTPAILGFVYFDFNQDGVFNAADDAPASNVAVTITGPGLTNGSATVFTDTSGNYLLDNLDPSSLYTVTGPSLFGFSTLPPTQSVTSPSGPGSASALPIRLVFGDVIIPPGGTTEDVSLSISGPGSADAGDTIEYDLEACNDSDFTITGVEVVVDLDSDLDFVDDSGFGGNDVDEDGNDITYTIGTLLSGECESWSVEADIDSGVSDGDTLTTRASMDWLQNTGSDLEVDLDTDIDSTTLTEEELQALIDEITRAAEEAAAAAGGTSFPPAQAGTGSEARNGEEDEEGTRGEEGEEAEGDDSELPGTGIRAYPGPVAHALILTAENISRSPLLTILVAGILLLMGLGVAAWGFLIFTDRASGILGNQKLWYAASGLFVLTLASSVALYIAIPNDPTSRAPAGLFLGEANVPNQVLAEAQWPGGSGVRRAPDQTQFLPPEIPAERLLIPAIDLDTELVTAPRLGLSWDVSGFTSEVAHLDGTAFPGTQGNSVIAGHIRTREGLSPFTNLTDLQPGDVVIAEGDGVQYIYTVEWARTAVPGESALLASGDASELTLITCGSWSTRDWAYLERFVVRATLTDIRDMGVGQ